MNMGHPTLNAAREGNCDLRLAGAPYNAPVSRLGIRTLIRRLPNCRVGFLTAAIDSTSILTERRRRWSSRLFLPAALVQSPNNANTPRSSNNRRSITVARLCLPDDANVAGNVHGGTILRLMEEAGMITATRHMAAAATAATAANGNNNDSSTATTTGAVGTLARFENMSFHEPLYVGEVASVTARPVFTSEHSMLIQVDVTGENLVTGKRRITNTGELWYVPLLERRHAGQDKCVVVKVPPIAPPPGNSETTALQDYERAKLCYEIRKKGKRGTSSGIHASAATEAASLLAKDNFRRNGYVAPPPSSDHDVNAAARRTHSPAASEQTLCQVVLPGDCAKNRIAFGGFVMKLMDNAAACSAYRHCRTNVVTVAISSMDFIHPVTLGEICSIHSKAVFASTKTLEMQVTANVTCARSQEEQDDTIVALGRFTFASLDELGKAIPVPPLKLETEADRERFFQAEQWYLAAKKARAAQQDVSRPRKG
jgi:acyl-coenzyme A thioesterase 7